jgi:hypothetical protein
MTEKQAYKYPPLPLLTPVTYFELEARVSRDSVRVRVVTRKVGENGRHFFQSVMKY